MHYNTIFLIAISFKYYLFRSNYLLALKHIKLNPLATSLQTSTIDETDRSKSKDGREFVNFPQPEVSSTMAEVCWYKEGEELQECDIITQSKEAFRALVVKTAELSHSGEHACETEDVTGQFAVDLPGDSSVIYASSIHTITKLTTSIIQWLLTVESVVRIKARLIGCCKMLLLRMNISEDLLLLLINNFFIYICLS